ncbi:nuclear transport factor 2 family protein [Sphingorhabdus sp.]|jgi:ketosteroid isomerase-like protein|uniref:nuclear transport factor 2 family protein n=1 Tax=Sphingorhabdus sp. TaxID=1902408 RepID=UPI00273DC230|nr:nuclear transport factor 2 family protein [Sphingorhabdus sp.]MDP4928124.1 nuclear transport factor 2 family protein [Sphingorhabdus sp.]
MTLSLQEMSDRFEIQDLMVGYCYAVDDRDFDTLDQYFTDDAVIDYTEMVPFKGSLAETKEFLRASLASIAMFQHAISTTQYKINGDVAETRTVCTNPMVVTGDDGQPQTLFFGLWYIHQFRRTAAGWRISLLREKKCYDHNLPSYIRAMTAG